jgi:signal transduction histidine kinase
VRHYTSDNGLPQNSIRSIKIDREGYTWLATEAGVVRYDGRQFQLVNTLADKTPLGKRAANLFLENDGRITAHLEGGIFYTVNNRLHLEPRGANEEDKNRLKLHQLQFQVIERCMELVKKGKMPRWALPDPKRDEMFSSWHQVAPEDGYFYFNEEKEFISADTGLTQFRKIEIRGLAGPATPGLQVSLPASQSGFYLRWGNFVYRCFPQQDGQVIQATPVIEVGDIPHISAIAPFPQAGLYAAGTLTDGIYIYTAAPFTTKTFNEKDANLIYAHAPFGQDGIVTQKGAMPPAKGPRLEGYLPFAMLKTREGRYLLNRWQSWEDAGIAILEKDLKEVQFIHAYNLVASCMYQAGNGAIWIAGKTNFLGQLTDTSINWLRYPPGEETFIVAAITEAAGGEMWLGGNTGLIKFNPATGKTMRVRELDNLNVRTLYQDKQGTLWIGTYGAGFYAMAGGKPVKLPLDKAGYLLNTHAFLEDENGYCWITTNQGLFQAKTSDLREYLHSRKIPYYHYYDRSYGFATNEFNGGCSPSAVVMDNGHFSLPSMYGAVQFDPLKIAPAEPSGPIRVDAVIAGDETYNPEATSFTIPGKTRQLLFSVSSPYYGHPANQVLRYQLKGQDDAFQDVPPGGNISFSNLAKGTYELILQKQGGFGGKIISKRIALYVQPLFYETWWFRTALILAIAALIWGIFRLRIRALIRQRTSLEKEVRQRTSQQLQLIAQLETAISALKTSKASLLQKTALQEKLAIIITHDLQSPLRFLSEAAGTISRTAIRHHLEPVLELSSELRQSTESIHRFVKDFGFWLKTMGDNYHLSRESVDVAALLEELQEFFTEMARLKNNRLEIHRPEVVTAHINRQMLTIILRNIIDNANKYTENGVINITVREDQENLTITITDTGEGIEPKTLHQVQAMLEDDAGIEPLNHESGYGYRFIADFCRLLHVKVNIHSAEHKGTTVMINHITKFAGALPANSGGLFQYPKNQK